MTQLLLFDAPATVSTGFTLPPAQRVAEPSESWQRTTPAEPLPQMKRSLPLYDPQRGEIHHLGDLAQVVLERYDIVARRRAVLLARGPRQAARA